MWAFWKNQKYHLFILDVYVWMWVYVVVVAAMLFLFLSLYGENDPVHCDNIWFTKQMNLILICFNELYTFISNCSHGSMSIIRTSVELWQANTLIVFEFPTARIYECNFSNKPCYCWNLADGSTLFFLNNIFKVKLIKYA